jgi:GntR family transcriptional regulator
VTGVGRRLIYKEIAEDIRRSIDSGELPPRARIGTLRSLCDHYEVAKGTIEKAVEDLREAGLVESVAGSGIYVTEPGARRAAAAASGDLQARLDELDAEWRIKYAALEETVYVLLGHVMDVYSKMGWPHPGDAHEVRRPPDADGLALRRAAPGRPGGDLG